MNTFKNKNILFLASWYPNRITPFNGNFIHKHARCVAKDVNLKVLAVQEDENLRKRFEIEEGNQEGVPHLIVYYKPPAIYGLKYFWKLIAFWKGFQLIRKEFKKIHLCHVHVLFDAGIIAYLLKLFYNIPYLITEHATLYQKQNWHKMPGLFKPIIRLIGRKSEVLLPVSNNLKRNMRAFGIKGNFEVIPNVVDTDLFKPSIDKKPSAKFRFLHISAFQEFKNIPGLLQTIKELASKREDFIFTIAGDGDYKKMEGLIKEHNIPKDRIQLKGKMVEKEVAKLMQQNDAFVLFSNFENLPCVLVEAQACALPLISTNVGGIEEIIEDEELGFLIEANDKVALLNSMEKIIETRDTFNVKAIRNRAERLYSQESIRQQFLTCYTNILK